MEMEEIPIEIMVDDLALATKEGQMIVICQACGEMHPVSSVLDGIGDLVGHVCSLEDRATISA